MPGDDITSLLKAVQHGDSGASDRLFDLVYHQLRVIARERMRHERRDHTLQPTALVHEAYVRLIGAAEIDWQNRSHFFRLFTTTMYRVLLDHARRRHAVKNNGEKLPLIPEMVADDSPLSPETLIALNTALTQLRGLSPRQAQTVELWYFCGFHLNRIAEMTQVSTRTVKRDLSMSLAWLRGALNGRKLQ